MANEIPNISHAAIVFQTFEDDAPALIINSWGIDEATLVKQSPGSYVVRLTTPLSLRLDAVDPGRLAQFSFITIVQGIALPNFVSGQPIPDPFAPPPAFPGAGGTISFGWLAILVTDADNNALDADAILQLQLRRTPNRS